jgi:hypothetical protein
VGAEVLAEPLQHPSRGLTVGDRNIRERRRHGRLDRAPLLGVGRRAFSSQAKHRTAAIGRIGHAYQQPLCLQAAENAGECARMDVEHGGNVTGRHTGKESDDTQDETLGAGDAKFCGHPFRVTVEAMHDGPQQLHEVKDVGQLHRRTDVGHGWYLF